MIDKNIESQDEFITILAERAGFTKGDIKVILDEIVLIFQECVMGNFSIKIRGLGKLYHQIIPERSNGRGKTLPPAYRTTFKLSENIRGSRFGEQEDQEPDDF